MKIRKFFLICIAILILAGFSAEGQTQKKKPAAKQPAKTTKTTKSKTPAKSPPKTQPAQTKKEQPKQKLANEPAIDGASGDDKRVRDIVSFLEFVLNTLGSEGTPARDKEVVITESYAKIFRD